MNDSHDITYSSNLELDVSQTQPSLAGPKRPQDRIVLSEMQSSWKLLLEKVHGRATPASPVETTVLPEDLCAAATMNRGRRISGPAKGRGRAAPRDKARLYGAAKGRAGWERRSGAV